MIDKWSPDVGSWVLDVETGRLAEFRGGTADCWRLRPVAGGDEWEVKPGDVWLTESVRLLPTASGPLPTPEPVAGCEECVDWWWAERLATDADELSEAVDCRVFFRRHLVARHGDAP